MPYKVISKLRHNGVYYNPSPGVTYGKKTKLPDGNLYLIPTPVADWSATELGKAKEPQGSPARYVEDKDIDEATAAGLVKDGVLEKITAAERRALDKLPPEEPTPPAPDPETGKGSKGSK